MKVVFLDSETFPPECKAPKFSFEHELKEYAYTKAEELPERIADAEIILVNKVILNSERLAQAKKLKMIALMATGSNNVDLEYCAKHNIVVSNIRDYGTRSVVEHTLALIFALRRDLIAYNEMIRKGEWQKSRQFVLFSRPVADLTDNVLAIVGKGNLGNALAEFAEKLGMRVIFLERAGATELRAGYTEFYEGLASCDILSLHCPLAEDNAKMMGEKEFSTMKKSAIFINTARGGLVDESALTNALRQGVIAGAGLDVLDGEPPKDDNPLLKVVDSTNLLITPHTAWVSKEALTAAIDQTVENIEAFVAGKPIRQLTA